MSSRGRTFAFVALIMVLAQAAGALAAPLAACAMASSTAHREAVECCPPGSHPPGQCPLHRKSPSQSDECRISCAMQGTTIFIPGCAGVLPPSFATVPTLVADSTITAPESIPAFRTRTPVSPPPKSFA
jgi:hypothetical protein